jgi:hypothetical protein
MLSNLKKWLLAGGDKSPIRRRNRLTQFRGQFERLEMRTVLSASIGPLPAELESPAYSVVSWDSGPIVAAVRSQFAPTGMLESHREDSRPLALESGIESPVMLRSSDRTAPSRVIQPQLLTYIVFVEIHPMYSVDSVRPPLRLPGAPLQSNAPSESIAPPLAGKSPVANAPEELHANQATNQSPLSARVTQPARVVASQYIPYTTEIGDVPSTPTASYVARDSVLRNYGADSLLLTTIGERRADDEFAMFDDDHLDSGDQSIDQLLRLDNVESPDDVALSLDALKRERAAIDAALSELHDVKAVDPDAEQVNARSADREGPANSDEFDFGIFTSDGERAFQPTTDEQDGGMVLLATSGDANSSAYDLSAVILSGMTDDTIVPLRVEASVGIYQAFDVGALDAGKAEQLPAGNSAGPTAQGATSLRTSAATANAPANKSEKAS